MGRGGGGVPGGRPGRGGAREPSPHTRGRAGEAVDAGAAWRPQALRGDVRKAKASEAGGQETPRPTAVARVERRATPRVHVCVHARTPASRPGCESEGESERHPRRHVPEPDGQRAYDRAGGGSGGSAASARSAAAFANPATTTLGILQPLRPKSPYAPAPEEPGLAAFIAAARAINPACRRNQRLGREPQPAQLAVAAARAPRTRVSVAPCAQLTGGGKRHPLQPRAA